jgi:hypothetical protein
VLLRRSRALPGRSAWDQPLWLWPNLLSLDAPLIAVLWMQLFAVSEDVRVSPVVTLVLGLAVWLIYVADRLFDGMFATTGHEQAARHRFHMAHRNVLLAGASLALALTCLACLELDTLTLEFGTLLTLVVLAYFGAIHGRLVKRRLHFPKEMVVAVVFGAGTFFPASIHARGSYPAMAIVLALFVVTCWLNLVLIEYAEWMVLRHGRTHRPHVSTVMAGQYLPWSGGGAAIMALLVFCSPYAGTERPALLALVLSAVALAGLSYCWRCLSTNAVRVLADVALLSPLIVLPLVTR